MNGKNESKKRLTIEGLVRWKEAQKFDAPAPFSGDTTNMPSRLYAEEALAGDSSFADQVLSTYYWKMICDHDLTPSDRAVLAFMLLRILDAPPAMAAVAGVNKKGGAPRRGIVGAQVAFDVLTASAAETSIENAIARVAEERNLSESRVKQHWIEWQDRIRESYISFAREQFADRPHLLNSLEGRYAKRKKGRKPPRSQSD
ncbi:hypothetical protein [Arenimonas donghaensis]|uniref:hypothetical protein n=1 Tax=Arenimonas donghaensis TaxID=375061 RepID=UPI001268920E|nr:hypothetical protein [Arenimonas donghaensis]